MRADEQKPDMRRKRRTSGRHIAKSRSIKDAKRRSGGCAPKAIELTPGDLLCVASATEGAVRRSDRRAKSAEGVLGQAVGKAIEALQDRKVEKQIGGAGNDG